MKTFYTFFALILINLTAISQVSMPYYSGFDNAAEQEGWTEYKKASTQFSHWGIASANAYSPPNCISHDYSPATGITLTDNWFVSPGFSIAGGGTLDSVRYMFSGFSVPVEGDTIGIYLLNGSSDPELASSVSLVFDFRDEDYIADFQYRVQEDINLPAQDGMSYIGIRYRNTDCSSKWLTVHFDNIAINGAPLSTTERKSDSDIYTIYPNPAGNSFQISNESGLKGVRIYDITGREVYISQSSGINQDMDVSMLKTGIYLVLISGEKGEYSRKLVIE